MGTWATASKTGNKVACTLIRHIFAEHMLLRWVYTLTIHTDVHLHCTLGIVQGHMRLGERHVHDSTEDVLRHVLTPRAYATWALARRLESEIVAVVNGL
jgi:hypothetical protein